MKKVFTTRLYIKNLEQRYGWLGPSIILTFGNNHIINVFCRRLFCRRFDMPKERITDKRQAIEVTIRFLGDD
jgi:hypothetical protein